MDDLTRLLVAAQAGDEIALAAFVRKTQADVWRLAAHLVDTEAADGITQDVYVRMMGALPSFRGDASAKTWLLGIARRTCADRIRSLQRRRRLLAKVEPATHEHDHGGRVALDDLVHSLAPDRRAAFVLTQLLGLSYAEAAAACEVPVGTIRSRVARAREDLAAMLGHGSDTGERTGS